MKIYLLSLFVLAMNIYAQNAPETITINFDDYDSIEDYRQNGPEGIGVDAVFSNDVLNCRAPSPSIICRSLGLNGVVFNSSFVFSLPGRVTNVKYDINYFSRDQNELILSLINTKLQYEADEVSRVIPDPEFGNRVISNSIPYLENGEIEGYTLNNIVNVSLSEEEILSGQSIISSSSRSINPIFFRYAYVNSIEVTYIPYDYDFGIDRFTLSQNGLEVSPNANSRYEVIEEILTQLDLVFTRSIDTPLSSVGGIRMCVNFTLLSSSNSELNSVFNTGLQAEDVTFSGLTSRRVDFTENSFRVDGRTIDPQNFDKIVVNLDCSSPKNVDQNPSNNSIEIPIKFKPIPDFSTALTGTLSLDKYPSFETIYSDIISDPSEVPVVETELLANEQIYISFYVAGRKLAETNESEMLTEIRLEYDSGHIQSFLIPIELNAFRNSPNDIVRIDYIVQPLLQGSFDLVLRADSNNLFDELFEENNERRTRVEILQEEKPDLQISNVVYRKNSSETFDPSNILSLSAEDQINVEVTVKGEGLDSLPTGSANEVEAVLKVDYDSSEFDLAQGELPIPDKGHPINQTISIDSLKNGEQTIVFNFKPVIDNFKLELLVDSTELIEEEEEDNNVRSVPKISVDGIRCDVGNINPVYQNDPNWNSLPYNGRQDPVTLGGKGCTITAASMLLNFYGGGDLADTLEVNSKLNELNDSAPGAFKGYSEASLDTSVMSPKGSGGNLNWSGLTEIADQFYSGLQIGGVTYLDTRTDGVSENDVKTRVKSEICNNQNPVIIRVMSPSRRRESGEHYVLAKSVVMKNGVETFGINDPSRFPDNPLASQNGFLLTDGDINQSQYPYKNKMFGARIFKKPTTSTQVVQSFRAPSSSNLSLLSQNVEQVQDGFSLRLQGKADFILIDELGRRTGVEAISGDKFNEIPGVVYVEEGQDDLNSDDNDIELKDKIIYSKESSFNDYTLTIHNMTADNADYKLLLATIDEDGLRKNSQKVEGVLQGSEVDSVKVDLESINTVNRLLNVKKAILKLQSKDKKSKFLKHRYKRKKFSHLILHSTIDLDEDEVIDLDNVSLTINLNSVPFSEVLDSKRAKHYKNKLIYKPRFKNRKNVGIKWLRLTKEGKLTVFIDFDANDVKLDEEFVVNVELNGKVYEDKVLFTKKGRKLYVYRD